MINLFRSELFRLRRRPQSWLLVIIASVLIAVFYGGLTISTYFVSNAADRADLKDQLRLENLREFGLSLNALFGGIMMTILAAGLIGNEYSWNTIRPIIARARSRVALLTAKFLTLGVYVVVFSFALAIATVLISLVCASIVGVSWGLDAAFLLKAVWYTFGLIAVNLPTVALAFLIAMWTQSNAAGIGVVIGLSFLEPAIFGLLRNLNDVFGSIEKWGISYNGQKVLTDGIDTDRGVLSLVVTLVYTVVFIGATYIIFQRKDVTSG